MSRKLTRKNMRERLLSNQPLGARIVLPLARLSRFLAACFLGINLLVWAALDLGTHPGLYWSSHIGLWSGILFAAFLIAEIQESILSQFQVFFLATVALLVGGIAGRWVKNTQLVFVLSVLAFFIIANLGLKTVFKEESEVEKEWEVSSKPFWIRSIVLIAPFMFALAVSTASFDSTDRSETLRFAIPTIVGFTYVCLCPPS